MKSDFSPSRRAWNVIMTALVWAAAVLVIALTVGVIGLVLVRGIPHISWEFLSTTASVLKGTDGILPAILNTLYVILLTLLTALISRDGEIAVLQMSLHIVLIKARQVDGDAVCIFLFLHIGLHQVLGPLAIKRILCAPKVVVKGVSKELIKQIFTKNTGQHKSFLHSIRCKVVPAQRSYSGLLF